MKNVKIEVEADGFKLAISSNKITALEMMEECTFDDWKKFVNSVNKSGFVSKKLMKALYKIEFPTNYGSGYFPIHDESEV